MEMVENLLFIFVELLGGLFVLILKKLLQFFQEEVLSDVKETLLGSDDLLVVELVVFRHGMLVLNPFRRLAVVELLGSFDDEDFELLELLEDLLLDLVVVVVPLVGIELLCEVRDGSPEVVLGLLKVVLDDLSCFFCGHLHLVLVVHGLHFDTFTDEFNAFTESLCCHGERFLCGFTSE